MSDFFNQFFPVAELLNFREVMSALFLLLGIVGLVERISRRRRK